jgi:hypothetical protein
VGSGPQRDATTADLGRGLSVHPAALPALRRATQLLGLTLGSALGRLRESGATATRLFERVEESALLLRMAREAAEILGARWDKVPERHRPLWIARIAASASVATEPASTRLAGCVSDVDRWLCELLAGAQVAPGYDALVAATFGASIPFSVRTSFNSGRERVRKGRSGERGNPNQLRHLRLHSDSVWDSGEAQETEYRYYRCVKKDKEGRQACLSSPLPADAIESYVIERLGEAITDGDLAQEVTAAVKHRVVARRKDLLVERKKLPGEIAKLSSEGKRLVETLADLKESARRLVERRLQEIGEQLERLETQLSAVERETAALDSVEVEAGWVGQVLADFTSVWDVLTPENRGRLLRAVVQSVEVDEPANKVTVVMADLGAGIPTAGEPAPLEATA